VADAASTAMALNKKSASKVLLMTLFTEYAARDSDWTCPPHGLSEIATDLIAALAGGIRSIAIRCTSALKVTTPPAWPS